MKLPSEGGIGTICPDDNVRIVRLLLLRDNIFCYNSHEAILAFLGAKYVPPCLCDAFALATFHRGCVGTVCARGTVEVGS